MNLKEIVMNGDFLRLSNNAQLLLLFMLAFEEDLVCDTHPVSLLCNVDFNAMLNELMEAGFVSGCVDHCVFLKDFSSGDVK